MSRRVTCIRMTATSYPLEDNAFNSASTAIRFRQKFSSECAFCWPSTVSKRPSRWHAPRQRAGQRRGQCRDSVCRHFRAIRGGVRMNIALAFTQTFYQSPAKLEEDENEPHTSAFISADELGQCKVTTDSMRVSTSPRNRVGPVPLGGWGRADSSERLQLHWPCQLVTWTSTVRSMSHLARTSKVSSSQTSRRIKTLWTQTLMRSKYASLLAPDLEPARWLQHRIRGIYMRLQKKGF